MKKGLNQGFALPKGISHREEFEMTKKAGFEGIEFNITDPFTADELAEIKALSKEFGIPVLSLVSDLHWQYHLTSNDPADRKRAQEITKELVTQAKELGADSVLVVPGTVNENVTYVEAYNNALNALIELKPFLEEMKVNVGIENVWNKFLITAFEMRDFIDAVDCPYVGSYFDAGNVAINAFPEYWIEILGKRIKKVHIKDFRACDSGGVLSTFVDLGEGDIRWDRVMKALREVGYDDYITCEVAYHKICPQTSLDNMSRTLDEILAL
ncbi:MAG: sugar phosphate isomerase/epimerase [Clostridiales bacterium]|nr:sugar phosphate isomerase/epimerase [Clostridiales bacterium]